MSNILSFKVVDKLSTQQEQVKLYEIIRTLETYRIVAHVPHYFIILKTLAQ